MKNESADLAHTFVRMIKAVPLRVALVQQPRATLVRQWTERTSQFPPSVIALLKQCETLEQRETDNADWKRIEDDMAKEFANDPALAGRLWARQDWPRPWWLVLREELKQIAHRRNQPAVEVDGARDLYSFVQGKNLVGLSLSGGGIRSATFNLGVLQALAKFGLLKHFDFLSTVSGGGYIGAWFASWLERSGLPLDEFEKELAPKDVLESRQPEETPIRLLRQFSNYLTPAVGFFSADTWTMAAIYLRNVLLNQVTLISTFGALLILPRFAGVISHWQAAASSPTVDLALMIAAGLLFIVSVSFIATELHSAIQSRDGARPQTGPPGAPIPPKGKSVGSIQLYCIWTLLIAVYVSSQLFWKHIDADAFSALTNTTFFFPSLVVFAILSLLTSLVGGFVSCFRNRLAGNSWLPFAGVLTLITIVTAATGTVILRGYILLMQFFKDQGSSGVWHAVVWGPPALLAVIALTAIVQVGLMGIDFPDPGREWLSRLRAITNVYTFFWLALFCAAVYGPLLIAKLGYWAAGLGTAWLGTTIAAVIAGRSSRSGQSKEGAPTASRLDLVAKIGPPVFLVGFILALGYAIQLVLAHPVLDGDYSLRNQIANHWDVLNRPLDHVAALWNGGSWAVSAPLILLLGLSGIAVLFAWRVDINEFSMHHFYKNRLVRCYLGASNRNRRPNPFIGFDDNDDLHMTDLRQDPLPQPRPSPPYKGPYHIVNTTLNLTAGGQLAWQERRATSFIFTPCHAGFDLSEDSDHPGNETGAANLRFCAYRNTERYAYRGGIRLGTAISISGAAADPNQGFNTSPAVAFLMTVFDVRLGWWIGNPRKDKESRLSSPRLGFAALMSSLFGMADDRSNFVSLSDGGHFDNMGIYELVRRRCKYIVLCDAEQDSKYTFGGLGMAIRKCRIDFGAEIEIDPSLIAPSPDMRRSGAHCAVGTIRYAGGEQGLLVYIKASITGDEPEDILQYAKGKPAFPHESTADQWFTESQFESYRKLGYHAALCTFDPVKKWLNWNAAGEEVASLFQALRNHWYPLNPAIAVRASVHTRTLNELFDKIRASEGLHRLGAELFPGGPFEKKAADPIAEYFFSMTLLQLVEDIYVDFHLDLTEWHDDPRIGGWMTIFRAWSKVPRMQITWEAGKETFRKDFQRFWETR